MISGRIVVDTFKIDRFKKRRNAFHKNNERVITFNRRGIA